MTLRRTEHPEATEELLDSITYYERRSPGLGTAFDVERRDAISDILEWPEAWPVFPGWRREPVVRGRLLTRFPCRVVYFVRGDEVVIVAYAHTSRKPGYWRHRVLD